MNELNFNTEFINIYLRIRADKLEIFANFVVSTYYSAPTSHTNYTECIRNLYLYSNNE